MSATHAVDIDEIQTTRGEKVLAVVLTAFPATGNTSCEGCGRTVTGLCVRCGERRRVGVQFCGSCGSA